MRTKSRNRVAVFVCVIAVVAGFAQYACAWQSAAMPVEPMQKTPVFRVNVVSRTTRAVNYRHRGGSTKIDFQGTQLLPQASGSATVESKTGRLEIDAKFNHLQAANKFGLEYLTYVLWAITPEGRAANLGELLLDDNGNGGLHVTTDLQAFGMVVTAEPYFAVTQPSDLVVVENFIRPDTLGRAEQINARYELLPRGMYTSNLEPIPSAIFGVDKRIPLDLFEARNALRVARAAQAEHYAAASFQKAEQLLRQAEDYYGRKQGRTPIGTVARAAVQTAEDARVISIRRQLEEQAEAERSAAADREAKAQAEQARAERAKDDAERAKADAERERQQSDVARAKAQAQQQAAEAEAQRSRDEAQEAERQRQQAEAEKVALRARLLQQLNAILATRDTPRGLVVNMSDVLFESGKWQLRPIARERLAKIAGIVLAYPELRLVAEGHTDSVGGEAYNQELSEKRAAAVRDYLAQQGIPMTSLQAMGFGKSQPVASNDTSSGRQLNRRVELVVSGDVIGTQIGGVRGSGTITPNRP